MRVRGLTRHKAGIYVFCILLLFSSITVARILMGYSRPLAESFPWVAALFVAVAILFLLFLSGWEPSAWIVVALFALYSGFFAPMGSISGFISIGVLLPIIFAAVLTNWIGILASGVAVFAIIAARRGYIGIVEQTVPVLNYLACVLGVLAAWLVQDKSRQDAEENAAKFERLNVELEDTVRARTAQLESANADLGVTNEELSQTISSLNEAQALLIASEKMGALGRLAADLAHELNTPLAAIASSSEVVTSALEQDLLEFIEKGNALGPAAFVHATETLRAISASDPFADSKERRERREAIETELAERGLEGAENLAADLALLGGADLARTLMPYLDSERGREYVDALGSLASALTAGRVIRTAADQAARVIQALRYYTRMETSREAPSAVDVRAELESLLAIYRNKLRHKVEVIARFAEDSTVAARPDELRQILVNLIDNALDAMEYRGRLELGTEADRGFLHISIGDSGPGIPESIAGRIFEPFFTTKKPGEGIGLGLDLVRRMAEAGGGFVNFKSEIGHTVFTVSLPRKPASPLLR